ncbi:uncharacterized protein LOC121877602 [Homarus americanus]|uniref:uncharacterized protein LOC121877602 n=1 Tax=Homarus americanus TaxID=6706 RepID=UPI001C4971B5|nr:uncharacterized protein LOC121877602 [Homarus americanus]
MPPPKLPRLRQCGSLTSLSLRVLEKSLLRAFYVLGKKGYKNTPEDLLVGRIQNDAITMLCEKDSLHLMEEMRSYLFPKLPSCYRQQLVDDIFTAMVSPEFDENTLITDIEFKFKSYDVIAGTSHMNQIIKIYLKCLLVGYVTSLDCGELYAMESCWVDRARTILHTWGKVKGDGSEFVKGIKSKKVNVTAVESMWKDLIFEHSREVCQGLVASASYFHQLVHINVDHVSTGKLIWTIGCNCPLLEHLSLYVDTTDRSKYNVHFEADLISSLSSLYSHKKYTPSSYRGRPVGCPKMQTMVMPSVTMQRILEKCTAKLLCYLPRLKEVINVCTTGTFQALLEEKDYKQKPLKLINIDESRARDIGLEDVCDDLKRVFPKVTSAKIMQRKQREGLRILSNFPGLKNLEIVTPDDTEIELGTNFTQITHFKSNCKWDVTKLAAFSQQAPNLGILFLLSGSLHRHKKSRDFISFPALRCIKLQEMTHIDPEPFTALIRGTHVLTHILLEDKEIFLNDFTVSVIKILNDTVVTAIISSLRRLVVFQACVKEFRGNFHYSMTMKSVDCFLKNCPKLEVIGNLFHWDIPYKDILKLKKKAKENNWNVNLQSVDNMLYTDM